MSKIPSLNTKVICITSDYELGAEISSLFNKKGEYFGILESPRRWGILTEGLVTEVVNQIAIIKPDYVILGNIEADISERIIERFPDKSMLIYIKDRSEIQTKLIDKFKITLKGELRVDVSQLGLGVFMAKITEKRLIPYKNMVNTEITNLIKSQKSEMIVCFEKNNNISDIISANYAFSLGSDLLEMPFVSREQADVIGYRIKKAGDENQSLDDIRSELSNRLPTEFDIKLYSTATFVTQGIPYSFILSNKIPIAHMFTNFLGKHILSSFIYSFAIYPPTGNTLIFSTRNFGSDEIDVIEKCFKELNYNIVSIYGKSATRKNFSDYVCFLPYDILHIATHGGSLEGMLVTEEFTDSKGKTHIITYDEVALFEISDEIDQKGEPMIQVSSHIVFGTFDGKTSKKADWIKEWLNFEKGERVEGKILKREPKKDPIVFSNSVLCSDGPSFSNFHFIANGGFALVFNASCSSLNRFGLHFIKAGSVGYVGTLWDVDTEVAKQVAENFYENLKSMPPYAALRYAQKTIENKNQKDIFCYFGSDLVCFLPFNDDTFRGSYRWHLSQGIMRWKDDISKKQNDPYYKDPVRYAKKGFKLLNIMLILEKLKEYISNSNNYWNCDGYKKISK